MTRIILMLGLLALAGCTTPQYMLRNDKTGQVATCGGSVMGSLAGGVIGYHIQKGNDEECVTSYKQQGFKVQGYNNGD